jgi:hypothetical protein
MPLGQCVIAEAECNWMSVILTCAPCREKQMKYLTNSLVFYFCSDDGQGKQSHVGVGLANN